MKRDGEPRDQDQDPDVDNPNPKDDPNHEPEMTLLPDLFVTQDIIE